MKELGLVAAGFLASLLTQWFTNDWARRTRTEERYRSSLDKHREEVSRALAAFITAISACLDSASEFISADIALTAAIATERHGECAERYQTAIDDFNRAKTDASVKAYQLLMLIKDDAIAAEIKTLALLPFPPERRDLRFDVGVRRKRLEDLVERLSGVFVPVRPRLPEPFESEDPVDADTPGKLLR